MRKITKSKEPKEWTKYKLTSGVDYQSIPQLRDSLLKEQGYICAYCMRRIPQKDTNSNERYRIDHVLSRDGHTDKKLDYRNMMICCPGAISAEFHCDKQKGNRDVTFSLFDDSLIRTLKYNIKTGKIESSNSEWDAEINNVLNLNNSVLKANRLQTLDGAIAALTRKHRSKAELRKELAEWDGKDGDGKFKPYCGIVVWLLNKKLKAIGK